MTLYHSDSSNSFSKVALAGTALAAALLISGCNKNDNTETNAAVSETETAVEAPASEEKAEAVTAAPTEAVSTATAQYSTLAQLSSDTLNNMVFEPLINSGQLTDEQKSCLEDRDKNIGIAEADAYFKSKLSKEELDELNAFYSSDIGKKLIVYGNEQLQIMSGQEVANPMPAPSEAEMAEMQQFMQSEVGQKYMQLNNAEGEGSMYEKLNPIIEAELARCEIEGVL